MGKKTEWFVKNAKDWSPYFVLSYANWNIGSIIGEETVPTLTVEEAQEIVRITKEIYASGGDAFSLWWHNSLGYLLASIPFFGPFIAFMAGQAKAIQWSAFAVAGEKMPSELVHIRSAYIEFISIYIAQMEGWRSTIDIIQGARKKKLKKTLGSIWKRHFQAVAVASVIEAPAAVLEAGEIAEWRAITGFTLAKPASPVYRAVMKSPVGKPNV